MGRGPLTTAIKGVRFLLELALLRVMGARVVWTVHNLSEHARRAPWVENLIKRAVMYLIAAGIVHCESARQATIDSLGLSKRQRRKLTVIPHGHLAEWYPTDVTRAGAREQLGIDETSTVFLYFGRILPYKNVLELIAAFESLPDDGARLLLVGRPDTPDLAARIAAAASDDPRIHLELEYVPDEAVPRYFAASDAVVLPFRDILSSGSAVLAASLHRAVIAPRIGCIADRFDTGSGLIYDPEAEGLETVMARGLRLDLDRIARQHYAAIITPDWSEIADATASVYRPGDTPPQ